MDITVWVEPGSRKGPLVVVEPSADQGHRLTVFVRERATDGKANTAVLHALANHYDLPRSAVWILHGHASRLKRIRLDQPAGTKVPPLSPTDR